jgi:hypothetical protein
VHLEMGLANDASRLRTASVRQDQRKYLAIRIVPAIVRIPLLISAITTKSTAVPVPYMTALYCFEDTSTSECLSTSMGTPKLS